MKEFLKGLKKGFENFGKNIAIIINSILLAIVYIIGVGITSIIAKIFGKHFMDMKISKQRKSYWSKLDVGKEPKERYYRPF